MSEMTPKQRDALARLRVALNDLDAQTRLPEEKPLTQIVAEHAREEAAKHKPTEPEPQ